MDTEIQLRWIASMPASGLHAADALRRGWSLADPQVLSAVTGPGERLIEEVRQMSLPEERFWSQLVALSADIDDSGRLVETVLQKVVGHGPRTAALASPLAASVAGLQAAVRRAMPEMVEQVAQWAQPLVDAWDRLGPAMLRVVEELTEPGLSVEQAGVVAVYPALGGGGRAHLWYNTVRIEVMPSDPVPDLPEVVRLAWLVSELQADLPGYSETIPRDRLDEVAAAAMIPSVLAAAKQYSLVPQGPLPIERAVEAWRPAEIETAGLADSIRSWWETYEESRPAWNVALSALNAMLYDSTAAPVGPAVPPAASDATQFPSEPAMSDCQTA